MRAFFGRLIAVAALAFSLQAHAQGAIQQSGAVVPFHASSFFRNGVVGDAGTPSAPYLNDLGLFNGASCPFGISSQTSPGVSLTPYSEFSICQSATATTLSVQGVNGQATPSVLFNIGGVTYPFPGPGSGNVLGPTTSTANDFVCWNNTLGTLLKDCGFAPGAIPGSALAAGAVVANLGYTPLNKAGDTMTGLLSLNGGLQVASKPVVAQPCPQIEAYGGVGNGSTDNSSALVAALAASPAASQCVGFGPGDFFFSSAITKTLLTGQAISFSGFGADVTALDFATSVSAAITINEADFTNSVHFRDLSVLTRTVGTQTGITLNQGSPTPLPATTALSTFDNVTLRGHDGYAVADFWATAVLVNQVSNINFKGLWITGAPGSGWVNTGVGVSLNGGVNGPCSSNFAVVYNFVSSTINYVGKGIVYGNCVQGVTITGGSNFTGGYIGVYVPPGETLLDQLSISDSQFNVFTFAVEDNSGVTNVMIHHNSVLLPQTSAAGFQLNTAQGFMIDENSFESLVGVGSTSAIVIGVVPTGYSGFIGGNYCNTVATCTFLASGSARITVGPQSYVSVTNPIVNVGTANSLNFQGLTTTVAGLGTMDGLPNAGDRLVVTDATACTANATPTGGGAVVCPVEYSGAVWRAPISH